jgi:Flp pilus assembly protein TadD
VRGQALYDRGDYQGAEEQFLKDLALHPASAPTWHVLALCRVERDDLPGALKALDQALAWDPANAAAWNDKASALAFLGRGSEALEHFRRAHELSPDNPLIMGNLARAMYLEKADLKKAAQLAARAAKLQPGNRRHRKTLAAIQKALGRQAASEPSRRPRPAKAKLKAKPPRKKARLKKRVVVRKAPRKPAPRRKMRPRRKKAPPKPAPRKRAKRKAAGKNRAAARAEAPLPLGYKAYIQVAAYRKRELAYQEMSAWLGRGYAARLEPWLKAPGDLRCRVLLGPYGSRSRARKMAARLQRKKWIKAYRLVTRPVK